MLEYDAMKKIPALEKIDDQIWEIPKTYKAGMKVPARIIATRGLLEKMDEGVFEQLTNVATLPGIQKYAIALPDAHWGYGAPIGCVFATDPESGGIISPGAVGFDVNCGMRLVKTNLGAKEVLPKIQDLVESLFREVPTGVGARGFLKLTPKELDEVIVEGASWAVKSGFGWPKDLENIEEKGMIEGADPSKISQRAKERGLSQLGTLGSGNHYLEIQKVEEIFDPYVASQLGIKEKDQVVVMIHCGSRGFGHQVATDFLKIFNQKMAKYGIEVPDKQLASAPFSSKEGQDYWRAMAASANMAFANRQIITSRVRKVFAQIFEKNASELGLDLIYDVCHNIAKIEEYAIKSENQRTEIKKLVVHRKGATRAFGPGHPKLSGIHKEIGQPVIIGGSMETGSYLLVGTKEAAEISFSSTCHGSGRVMSRVQAKKEISGKELEERMRERGIYVRSVSYQGLAEEAGIAYKDISEVVDATEKGGISKKVARFVPIGNIKG